jgi:hypothetical protein
MEFFSGILLGETSRVDKHASLMISALLKTIMITLTMMRMTELRAKPEPKENKHNIEHNIKIFESANLPTKAFSACYILLQMLRPSPCPKDNCVK